MDFFGWLDPKEKTRTPPALSEADHDSLVPEVRRLLSSGQKIEAVKAVRERQRAMGMKEAKDFVDTVEREMKFDPAASGQGHTEDDPLEEELRGLLSLGRKIDAIMVLREHRVMGLKEAKDYVDDLERQMKQGR